MDDMERYGDYNEVDESPVKKKNPVLLFLKIMILSVCVLVVGVIAFRVILFNYYPSEFKKAYVDEALTDAYNQADGKLDAVTQELRFGYDDPDAGNFFADHLIVIRDMNRVQITLRLNISTLDNIAKKYKVDKIEWSDDLFSFKLFRNNVKAEDGADNTVSDTQETGKESYTFYNRDIVGEVVAVEQDSFLMYRYFRIVIDDVDFNGINDDDIAEWLSLGIYVKGFGDGAPFSRMLIYENHADYSDFKEFKIDSGDLEK